MIARYKPNARIIAITNNEQTYDYLSMEWNVTPIYTDIEDMDIFDLACTIAKEEGIAKTGENIIVTTGSTDPISNVIRICTID